MADELLTPPARPALRERIAALPVAVRIAVIYALARVITSGLFLIAAALAPIGSRFATEPGLGSFAAGWDAWWYWFVASYGYPSQLPLTDTGLVAENAWAFMPLYAYLAAGVGAVFGSWVAGAVALSLVAGYLACLVLYRMMRLRGDDAMATWAVVFFAAGPLAGLFQVGYAETLFLLWLFLALWCLMQRRYSWLWLLIPLMGFTRPGVLAFALLLGLHGIHRWVTRRQEPLRPASIVSIVALGAWATIVGFSWQVIAALGTGRADAYLSTELAWRRNWVVDPPSAFLPFEGFVSGAELWAGQWGIGRSAGIVLLVGLVLSVAALLLFEPHVKRLGLDLRLWAASYLLYLLAVFFPQSSIFRLLVPLSPLWGAVAMPRSLVWRGGVLVLCLIGQWWWIYNMYALAGLSLWSIP